MKYFKEKNIPEPFWVTDTKKDDKRVRRFLAAKKELGVDPREAWNMDYSFIVWLYNTLNVLVEDGGEIVDFTYHKITICGNTKNELEWIEHLLRLCELNLRNYDNIDELENCHYRINAITKIFHKIIHYLWW